MKAKPTYDELVKKIEYYENNGLITDTNTEIDIDNHTKYLERVNNIIEGSTSVMFLAKNELNFPIEYVSNNVEQLFGYTANQFLKGKISFFDIIYPKDLENVLHKLNNFKVSKSIKFSTKPLRSICENGDIKWVKVNFQKVKALKIS